MNCYQKNTFKNGLRVITVPMKNTRAVTVLVLVGTGSKYETEKTNGISHFLEHMFFKGTKKRPSTLKIAESLDKIGGTYNAFTGKELTGFWAKTQSKHLDLTLDWISDIFLNSKFEQEKIEREKGVIAEEINMYQDTPIQYAPRLWEKLLYGDQPAGWLTIGKKENIRNFSRQKILKYLKNNYSSKNTVVCVAGDIDSKEVEKKIKKYFKDINKVPSPTKNKVEEEQTNPKILSHSKKTDQTHLCLGVRGYNKFHPLKYAQGLLSVILGGNMSSRIFISLRVKKGFAYYVKTSSESNPDTGYLVTQAGIRHQKLEEAVKLILKEYKSLKQKGVKKAELKKAKDYLKGGLSLSLESSDTQASFYAGQELLDEKILTPKQKFTKIDEVSLNDIKEVARNIFQPQNLNLALIGALENKKRLKKILEV